MKYPKAVLFAHPGFNPNWGAGPLNRSRWIPHNGKREMARRVLQVANAARKAEFQRDVHIYARGRKVFGA